MNGSGQRGNSMKGEDGLLVRTEWKMHHRNQWIMTVIVGIMTVQ